MLPNEIIAKARQTSGATMQELADRLGFSLASWADLEYMTDEIYLAPGLKDIISIMSELSLKPAVLFQGQGSGIECSVTVLREKLTAFLGITDGDLSDRDDDLDWNIYPFLRNPYDCLNDYNLEFLIYVASLVKVNWVSVLEDLYISDQR